MTSSNHFLLIMLFLLPLGVFSQIDSTANVKQNYNLHLLDLFLFDVPGIKVSYERSLQANQVLGFEVGLISDLNASIFRLDQSEKGIVGGHLGLNYMFSFPISTLDYNQVGIRLNYTFKERKIKDWILIDQAYRQKLSYRQTNNNIALYLRIVSTRRYPNGFSFSLGINPGIMIQLVNTNLPTGASVNDSPPNFGSNVYSSIKDSGRYLIPHLYLELNVGYTFNQS